MIDWPGPPLPDWVSDLRPMQIQAARDVLDAYKRGADVVILDAPVGSGKTLVAELVRRGLEGESGLTPRGTYICHGLDLQDQVLHDFSYSRTLKGRANYPTLKMPRAMVSAADCRGKACVFCDPKADCPYLQARKAAALSPVAVLNTAYFMAYRAPTYVRSFITIDECDTLEGELMRHLEFRVSGARAKVLGTRLPIKAARKTTIARWLREDFRPVVEAYLAALRPIDPDDYQATRLEEQCQKELGQIEFVAGELEGDGWVRDYEFGRDDLILKPVTVGRLASDMLWARGEGVKWLCMSGTVISTQEWVTSVGLEDAGLEWEVVSVPMTFPVKNRPVVLKMTADMSRSGQEEGIPKVVAAIAGIVDKHAGENVLVHCVSYALMRALVVGLREAGVEGVISYEGSGDRALALRRFKEGGGVIVAPSLDRGVDLPDDMCRVQVVAKMPFAYLGDSQVNARLHTANGKLWYAVLTARDLVQMLGRGVRHEEDWCVSYVLDQQFIRWYRTWGRTLLPGWFREAIQADNGQ